MNIIVIVIEKIEDSGTIGYLLLFALCIALILASVLVVAGGFMSLPYLFLDYIKTWYFYLFAVLCLLSNVLLAKHNLEWWKTWLWGDVVFALGSTIAYLLFSGPIAEGQGFVMNIIMFFSILLASLIIGSVISGVGSLISYTTSIGKNKFY